jgi:hypothetical protein
MSLGFWVNANCVNTKRASVDFRYAIAVWVNLSSFIS